MENNNSRHCNNHDDNKTSSASSDDPSTHKLSLTDNNNNKLPAMSIANDNTTFHMFNFATYSRKPLKTGEFKGYEKKYYNCTDKECTVCYYILTNSSNMMKKYKHSHNHNPSAKLYPCKEVKEKAVARLRAGNTPVVVHRDLTNNALLPLSSAFVPTLSTVRNWQKRLFIEDMPTGIFTLFLFYYYFLFIFYLFYFLFILLLLLTFK
eukprot:Phypoly_transcript_04417.p1 GENE.Phypoly_transcript_04417~~Phypoly_transcript_04417.p1  ORF type:complete len:207 (-),score=25.70 Phypoly_transcript_04417:158-778(-)